MSLPPIARHLMIVLRTFFLNDALQTVTQIPGLHWAFYIVDNSPLHCHGGCFLSERLD